MKIIDFGNVKADFVNGCINRLISTYMDALHQKTIFESKLNRLVVTIYIVDYKSIGHHSCNFSTGESEIILEINPRDSKKLISFIIAHEFAHMLFTNPYDTYCVSGKASDGSTNYGAIQRINPTQETYGYYLEEIIADYVAHFIVAKLNYDDKNDQYKNHKERYDTKIKIVSKFESIFGQSLFDGEFIDEIYFDENKEARFNYFWGCILSFSFNNIVDIFDETMGKNEFYFFCELIDMFCEKDFENMNTEAEELEIFEKLNCFTKKIN